MDRLLEATARAEREHFWFHGFRRFVAPLLEQAAAGRRDLLSLDCGCGTGNNLALLRALRRMPSVSTSRSLDCSTRTSRGDHSVAQASATALPFPGEAFDLVSSFDVVYALAG